MRCKDIPDNTILEYLYAYQGQWTGLWFGHFGPDKPDVFHAFPTDTPPKVIRAKMKKLHDRGLVGGCPCGCRGDFEITDKGLALLGKPRIEPYTGY